MASKSVLINLGSGDLHDGFPRVTAQLWGIDPIQDGRIERSLPEQYVGSLPPAPQLARLYRNWQTLYQGLCSRFQLLYPIQDDDALEIEEGGITNVSQFSFEELCQQFQAGMNEWLRSETFLNIDRQVRSQLDPAEEIRVIIETNDELMRRLPWQQWEFFKDYPKAEMALARPEYKRRDTEIRAVHQQVRILAILGDTQDIDIEAESQFLHGLTDAEVELLVNPSRPEFTLKLWDSKGWDILFFAGHSYSEGETGRIYLNERESEQNSTENSLTIEQLEEALKTAVENGLQLAIFNSCDGLGLAIALEKLHTPVAIVMREPVPNRVAQEFFNHFLTAFAQDRQSLYLSVQQARRKLQGLEHEFPGASWLPAICQNPAVEPPTWLGLGGVPTCPYRDLAAFASGDEALFWGREAVTRDLVAAVRKKPLVALVGASGSGKTSLINAGLIPKLAVNQPLILTVRLGHDPWAALAALLIPHCHFKQPSNAAKLPDALRKKPEALGITIERVVQQSGKLFVLVIEAFDELYRLCSVPVQRLFLEQLLAAVHSAPGFAVVLVMRSDFYPQAIAYRPLEDALRESVHWLTPMTHAELQSAIEQPAAQMGVQFEKGLVEKIIQDLGHPSRLAILEMLLTQLWTKQQQGWLTHQAYEDLGGFEKVLTRHAETVYAQLPEGDRRRSQRLLTQLVQWHPTTMTAREATQIEVKPEHWDLVTQLATARLVTTQVSHHQPTVAIAHELLIQSWGRLEHWMQVNGEFRRWQDQLRTAIATWQTRGQPAEELLQGKSLSDAEAWQKKRTPDLSAAEQGFIELSRRHFKQEQSQERRRIFLLKSMLGLMGAALLGAVGLGGVALWKYRQARIGQAEALATSADSLFALNRRLDALVQALNAQHLLRGMPMLNRSIATYTHTVLLQTLYGTTEINRLPGGTAIATSTDGQWIAIGTENTVQVWQPQGQFPQKLQGHQGPITSIAFNAKGIRLASSSEDHTVKIWQLDPKKENHWSAAVTLQGHTAAVRQVIFSPEGDRLVTASDDGTVRLWRINGSSKGELQQTLPLGAAVTAVAFSPDGRTLGASAGNKIQLWRIENQRAQPSQSLAGQQGMSLSFSPDNQTLAAAGAETAILLWQRGKTGGFEAQPVRELGGHLNRVAKVAFSPDGRMLASASWDGTVKLWDQRGTLLQTLKGHAQQVWDLAFSFDGKTLASSGGVTDQTRFWQVQNPSIATLNAPAHQVLYHPDGKLLALVGKTLEIWRSNGVLQQELFGSEGVGEAAFDVNGQLIAAATPGGIVKLWQLNPNTRQYEAFSAYKTGAVARIVFSPKGDRFAIAQNNEIQIWAKTGTLLFRLTGHRGTVRAIAFSPDDQWLVSAGDDNTVKIWRKDGTLVRTLEDCADRPLAIAFSPDSKFIAAAGESHVICIWRSDGTYIQAIKVPDSKILSLAFSPDGQHLATAGTDQAIRFWHLDGRELAVLKGHSKTIQSIAFNPQSQQLASTSEDGTAKLWKLDIAFNAQRLEEVACNTIRNYLSHQDDQYQPDFRRFCGVKHQRAGESDPQ